MSICPHACAWGQSKAVILRFFNSGYAHDRNIRFLDVGHSFEHETRYASVRQSRESLHRDRHKVAKKSRGGAVL